MPEVRGRDSDGEMKRIYFFRALKRAIWRMAMGAELLIWKYQELIEYG
jgi:hypothetical protein